MSRTPRRFLVFKTYHKVEWILCDRMMYDRFYYFETWQRAMDQVEIIRKDENG